MLPRIDFKDRSLLLLHPQTKKSVIADRCSFESQNAASSSTYRCMPLLPEYTTKKVSKPKHLRKHNSSSVIPTEQNANCASMRACSVFSSFRN